jgi:hypothetical protein
MKKEILLIATLCAGPAWAEWVQYSETNTDVFYLDPATIQTDGQFRKVWIVDDIKVRDSEGALSYRLQREYDCKNERYRLLSVSTHAGPMASGETLVSGSASGSWMPISPNTPSESALKIVCRQ